MMKGVNIEATVKLAQSMTIPVIASGGVHTITDVEALCAVQDEGVQGVICGRSIYEGTLDLRSAQDRADELSGDLDEFDDED
jgi:phosphoribosylformimino-5-aminoimidazole carboxamide ribotide isomerase